MVEFFFTVYLTRDKMPRNHLITDLFLLALDRNRSKLSIRKKGIYHFLAIVILSFLLLISLFRFRRDNIE